MVGIHINIEKKEGDIIFGADLQRSGRFQSWPVCCFCSKSKVIVVFFASSFLIFYFL